MDQREVTLPVPLDLSAAFDTMDHEIMLEILKSNFGVGGNALGWIKSFLSDRKFRSLMLSIYEQIETVLVLSWQP